MNHEDIVRGLIAAIHLRTIIKLIRKPDRLVDRIIADTVGSPSYRFTRSLFWAESWAGLIAPGLEFGPAFSVGHGLFSVRAWIDGDPDRPYPIWMAAESGAIPICFGALNWYIDSLIHKLDLNSPSSLLTETSGPSRLLTLTPALEALGDEGTDDIRSGAVPVKV